MEAKQEWLSVLQGLLGDRCKVDEETKKLYGKDYSHHESGNPDVVVFPTTQEEVAEIVKLCDRYHIPLITYGSGTSLEGHTTCVTGGICLSLQHMDKILQINPRDMDVVVQPGLSFNKLNDQLKQYNLHFPLDAGPSASIGGMVATSASGTKAVRYGTMKENVIALKAVLPNGTLVKTANRARKCVSGYDLTHLLVASEGTLAVVTEITLRVYKIPKYRAAALINFPTIADAANTVIDMMALEDTKSLTMVELLDGLMMRAINKRFHFTYAEEPTLYFEFGGDSPNVLAGQEASVRRVADRHGGGKLLYAESEEEMEKLWKARKAALFASKVLRPEVKEAAIWTTDVCVPLSRLADCITGTIDDLRVGFPSLVAPLVGHVGDGNFHLFIVLDPSNPKELEEAKKMNARLVARAIEMDGTCTGEHGVGVGKRDYVESELGAGALDMMWAIKQAIDPKNIMNPGKKLRPRGKLFNSADDNNLSGVKITSQLDLGPQSRASVEVDPDQKTLKMHLDWSGNSQYTAKL